jgi:hypothetical protein
MGEIRERGKGSNQERVEGVDERYRRGAERDEMRV